MLQRPPYRISELRTCFIGLYHGKAKAQDAILYYGVHVDSQDIRVQSSFEELGSMVIDNFDLGKWPGEAVLCRNDSTPHNLILPSQVSSDGKSRYALAGIIDRELAAFYPASYELSLRDTYLTGGNRHASIILYSIEITHEEFRATIAATDFTFCKPWSSSLSPGRNCCMTALTFPLSFERGLWST